MSAWSRFWRKWNSCRPCVRGRAVIGTVLQLLGSMVASFAILYSIQLAAATAAAAPVYQAGPCADCPAGTSLETVQVQAREGSILFVVGGTLPVTVSGLPADVRLEANDLDIVLRPDEAGFRIVSAARAGAALAPDLLAAGIADGHLVIDVRENAIRAPIAFSVGLWKDGAYRGRIPASGRLEWAGRGAPRTVAAPTTAALTAGAPTTQPTPVAASPVPTVAAASPARTAAAFDVTTLAGSCTSWNGQLPAFLPPTAVTTGTGPDPRSSVPTRWISTAFGGTVPNQVSSRGTFSVTVVIARAGQATGSGARLIDRAGSIQLWAHWDGSMLHKAIRTWSGTAWEVRVNADTEPLTVALRTNSLIVYWEGLRPGDRYGAVVAAPGGCRAVSLDAGSAPQQAIP